MRSRRTTALILVAACIAPAWSAAQPATATLTSACTSAGPAIGAAQALGTPTPHIQAALASLAPTIGLTPEAMHSQLAADRYAHIDTCGQVTFTEPPLPKGRSATTPTTLATPFIGDGVDAFALHSRPGSGRVVYLDFLGSVLTGTKWNLDYNSPTLTVTGYSQDGNPSFNATEKAAIQAAWAVVAEDFAPFDVDVTTEPPAPEAIWYSGPGDTNYGVHVHIGEQPTVQKACKCGGIAPIKGMVAEADGWHHPLVFAGATTDAKVIGEVASHEVGHTVGLLHDGQPKVEYYHGSGGWAPIMGVGYYQPLSQWSKGEYAKASNTQDDIAVITATALPLVTDDYPDDVTGAQPEPIALTDGAASLDGLMSFGDSDLFTFTTAVDGTTVQVVPQQPWGTNLDVKLAVAASGTFYQESSAKLAVVSAKHALGLGTSVYVPTAGTYTIAISGTGQGGPKVGGWSGYGSAGRYTLLVEPGDTAWKQNVDIDGGTEPMIVDSGDLWFPIGSASTWKVPVVNPPPSSDSAFYKMDPVAGKWSITPDGWVTGTPASATKALLIRLYRDGKPSIVGTLTVHGYKSPVIEAPTLKLTTGVPAYKDFYASGVRPPVVYTATDLPTGLSLDTGGTLTGTPTAAGTWKSVITVTDAANHTAMKTVPMTVKDPLSAGRDFDVAAYTGYRSTRTLPASGGWPAYKWTVTSGALPPGMKISAGTLMGIPTLAGNWSATLTATDSAGISDQVIAAITVTDPRPLTLDTSRPGVAAVGRGYAQQMTASGAVPPYSWKVARGTLPPGLQLGRTTGAITGITTTAGTWTFDVTVTAANAATATGTVTITVDP